MIGRILGIMVAGAVLLAGAACSSKEDRTPNGGGNTAAQGGSAQGGNGQGNTGQGGTGQGGTGQGGTTTGDPHETYHQLCIDKINALRATLPGRTPYSRWNAIESCVDTQAVGDEQDNHPHEHFGACGESGQNECEGQGMTGIESCLDMMWAEKNQAGCSGCDACADAYNPSCPNCDFYGSQTGNVCGHYVNMSAKYFTEAACGFNSAGSWATIDFH